jgi:hypothetical protein
MPNSNGDELHAKAISTDISSARNTRLIVKMNVHDRDKLSVAKRFSAQQDSRSLNSSEEICETQKPIDET